MVCRLYGNFKPHTASLLLQRKSKLSDEEKHTTSTVSSVARATYDPPCIKYQQKTGRAQMQETASNPKGQQALGSKFQPTVTNKSRQEGN